MKIKQGFVTRQVFGRTVVVATGELYKKFGGMITLNNTGADIWEWISKGSTEQECAVKLTEKYEVSMATAVNDVSKFIGQMSEAGVFEEK